MIVPRATLLIFAEQIEKELRNNAHKYQTRQDRSAILDKCSSRTHNTYLNRIELATVMYLLALEANDLHETEPEYDAAIQDRDYYRKLYYSLLDQLGKLAVKPRDA